MPHSVKVHQKIAVLIGYIACTIWMQLPVPDQHMPP